MSRSPAGEFELVRKHTGVVERRRFWQPWPRLFEVAYGIQPVVAMVTAF